MSDLPGHIMESVTIEFMERNKLKDLEIEAFPDCMNISLSGKCNLVCQMHMAPWVEWISAHLSIIKRKQLLFWWKVCGLFSGVGVYISRVEEGSVAERAGLRPGDTILEVNGTPFRAVTHEEALKVSFSFNFLITFSFKVCGFATILFISESK